MKKFFKSLALVLAFAMLATSVNFAKADAANSKITAGTTQLFVGSDAKLELTVDKPSDAATAYSYTWSSSDEDTAKVDQSGAVTAGTKAGSATITCTVVNVKTNAKTTLTKAVKVYANAAKVEITNAPADGIVKIGGEVVDLNRTLTNVNGVTTTKASKGNTVVTDKTVWTSSNTEVADVDASGVITAKAAGDVVIYATTYDVLDTKNEKKTAQAALALKVVADAATPATPATPAATSKFAVKQTSETTAEITLATAVDKVELAKTLQFSLVLEVKSTGEKYDIKLPCQILSVTDNVAKVNCYSTFNEGKTYKFVNGSDEDTFVAYIGKVAYVKTFTDVAGTKQTAEVKYAKDSSANAKVYARYFNDRDMDITKTATGLPDGAYLEYAGEWDSNYTVAVDSLSVIGTDAIATITAGVAGPFVPQFSVTYYDAEGYTQKIPVFNTAVVTFSQEKDREIEAAMIPSLTGYTTTELVNSNQYELLKDLNVISISDTKDQAYQFIVAIKDNFGNAYYNIDNVRTGIPAAKDAEAANIYTVKNVNYVLGHDLSAADGVVSFESTDNDRIMVSDTGYFQLNTQGLCQVIVYFTKAGSTVKEPIGVISFTAQAARTDTTIKSDKGNTLDLATVTKLSTDTLPDATSRFDKTAAQGTLSFSFTDALKAPYAVAQPTITWTDIKSTGTPIPTPVVTWESKNGGATWEATVTVASDNVLKTLTAANWTGKVTIAQTEQNKALTQTVSVKVTDTYKLVSTETGYGLSKSSQIGFKANAAAVDLKADLLAGNTTDLKWTITESIQGKAFGKVVSSVEPTDYTDGARLAADTYYYELKKAGVEKPLQTDAKKAAGTFANGVISYTVNATKATTFSAYNTESISGNQLPAGTSAIKNVLVSKDANGSYTMYLYKTDKDAKKANVGSGQTVVTNSISNWVYTGLGEAKNLTNGALIDVFKTFTFAQAGTAVTFDKDHDLFDIDATVSQDGSKMFVRKITVYVQGKDSKGNYGAYNMYEVAVNKYIETK